MSLQNQVEILPPEHSAKRPALFVLEALLTQPWAVTEEMFSTMVSVANREHSITPEALEAYRGNRIPNASLTSRRGNVAVMTMVGPMFRYADMFTELCGGVTYDAFARELTQAIKDPSVTAVLLNWDSPGGHANGVAEAAQMIAAYSAIKPIESYAGGQMCSAAYWMGVAASRVTIDRTAMLGSIGVRLGIRDSSERDARSGVRNIEIVSSRAPNKRTDLDSDEGRARLIRMADQMEAVFIADVAAMRGVSEDEVVSKFGAGGVEIGTDAVQAGMADALGSFEEVLERLTAGNGKLTSNQRKAKMTTGTTTPAVQTTAAAPAAAEPVLTQAQIDAARTEGATAAQARIAAIMTSPEGKANPALAEHFAYKTTTSATDAIAALAVQGASTPAATTPAPAATTTAAQVPAGERSKDTAGGLALAAMTDNGGAPAPAATAPVLSTKSVYANRAKTVAEASR